MKTIKVLDLFSGVQSVKKSLKFIKKELNINLEYYGVDIYSPEDQNLIVDLSKENALENLKKKLNGWVPDLIWASPPCNKFSMVIPAKNGNAFFILNKKTKTILPRRAEQYRDVKVHGWNKKPEIWIQKRKEVGITLKMYENMEKIIKYYNVPYFIENPAFALSQYLLKKHKRKITYYCMYGFLYKKPTAIYYGNHLDKDFILEKCIHKKHKLNMQDHISKYAERSKVAPKLIASLFLQALSNNYYKELKLKNEKQIKLC